MDIAQSDVEMHPSDVHDAPEDSDSADDSDDTASPPQSPAPAHHSPIPLDDPSRPPSAEPPPTSDAPDDSRSSTDTPAALDGQPGPKSKPSSSAVAAAPSGAKPKSAKSAAPRAPSPSPPPAPARQPLQTIRLDIALGGPEDYEVNISDLAKQTGQRPATPVPEEAKRDTSDESDGDDEAPPAAVAAAEEVKEKGKRRKRVSRPLPSFFSLSGRGPRHPRQGAQSALDPPVRLATRARRRRVRGGGRPLRSLRAPPPALCLLGHLRADRCVSVHAEKPCVRVLRHYGSFHRRFGARARRADVLRSDEAEGLLRLERPGCAAEQVSVLVPTSPPSPFACSFRAGCPLGIMLTGPLTGPRTRSPSRRKSTS